MARWNNIVKDYLTFSAKERTAVFVILFLIILVYLLSIYLPANKKTVSKNEFANELAQLKITVDSSHKSYAHYNSDDNSSNYYKPKDYDDKKSSAELFAFDPNTLDDQGWKRLGVRDKTVSTIQKFLSKGFRFKQPEDLKKIYGLSPELSDRLMPYVTIASANSGAANSNNAQTSSSFSSFRSEPKAVKIIDVNLADTTAFISLPGIGNRLAVRIVGFREKLGGFYSVGQVGETYGVPDSTFQKIKGRLQCGNPSIKKLGINTADVSQLKAHPYIRWAIANAIVNYRSQHGNFNSLQDLKKIDVITEEAFNKMAPYLTL